MNHFKHFATMIDCSRNAVVTVDAIKWWINLTADLDYNALHLYMEDTYEIENEPYFGHLRGKYSQQELREIDAYADANGMAVIPCIQTLAHVNALFHWPVYQEIQDVDDILLADEARTYDLVDRMFATLHNSLRSRTVNIGMDEAGLLGLGRYLTLHGYQDRYSILMNHLRKVSEIAKKYGFKLLMWGDMFFRLATGGEYYADYVEIPPEIKELVPDNVQLVYWDYYSTTISGYEEKIQQHNAIKENIWFAGGLWSWSGYALCDVLAAKYDLGVRTRDAYHSRNLEMIKALVTDYDTLLSLLDHFYTSYEVQWMYDNKPHGFDVIDLRLGGLRQRIVHCMKRLQAYVDRKLTRIEELEEPVLDCCCIENAEAKPLNRARFWNEIATANVIDVVLLNRQRIFCRNTQKCASQKSPPNAYRKQLTCQ